MGLPPDIQEKYDKLDKKLKEANEEYDEDYGHMDPEEHAMSEDEKKSAAAGSIFLSSVIGGGLLGYGIDWFFGTLPWGLLFFIVMGFVSAVIQANAAMKKDD